MLAQLTTEGIRRPRNHGPEPPACQRRHANTAATNPISVCAATQQNLSPQTQWARNRYKTCTIRTRRTRTQIVPKPPRTKRYAHRRLSVGKALTQATMPPNDAMKYTNQLDTSTPQSQKQQNFIRGVVNFEKGQKRANRDIARQGVNFENVLPVWERLQFHSVQQLRKQKC